MGNYLNIGNDGFASVVKGPYVDKTGMIEYINSTLGTKEKLICVSRPRRFGKSSNNAGRSGGIDRRKVYHYYR